MLENKFYTTKEISNIIGIAEYTLRKYIRENKLHTMCKRGKSYMISLENLKEYAIEYNKPFILDIISGKVNAEEKKVCNNIAYENELL